MTVIWNLHADVTVSEFNEYLVVQSSPVQLEFLQVLTCSLDNLKRRNMIRGRFGLATLSTMAMRPGRASLIPVGAYGETTARVKYFSLTNNASNRTTTTVDANLSKLTTQNSFSSPEDMWFSQVTQFSWERH